MSAASDKAPQAPGNASFGRFEILLAERRLRVDGQPAALGSRAFDLLAALVTRRDRVVPKEELIEIVWPGLVVEENNLQVQISALRKVLGSETIATVPGRGYRFTAPAAGTATSTAASLLVHAPDAHAQTSRWHTASRRPSRLLVVDDNKVNRLLLCRSLELMGHEVASCDNGRTALEMLRSERFDLLLLDLAMPEVDGFSLLEKRVTDAVLSEVPVIVTSALEGVAGVARCIELGADDFLHKPLNQTLLKARVESSLERKHLRDRERELVARLVPPHQRTTQARGHVPGGRNVEATMLVARVNGFGVPAPDAAETIELLDNWRTLMLDAIDGHGGLIAQLAGDAISAVFGVSDASAGERAPLAAVETATEMLKLVTLFNLERSSAGKAGIVAGIGIASGEVCVGEAGMPQRTVNACVGIPTQRAAWLQTCATQSRESVLLDAETQGALSGRMATEVATVKEPREVAAGLSMYTLKGT
jgi:adenylate cyclase